MKIKNFEEIYKPEFRCLAKYTSLGGEAMEGIILEGITRKPSKAPWIVIESYQNPVALARVSSVEVTEIKW